MCWVPLGGWVRNSHHCWFSAHDTMFSQTFINEREWQLQQILHINITFLGLGATKGYQGGKAARPPMENGSSLQNCPPQPSQASRCSNIPCLERFWLSVLFLGSSGCPFQSLKLFWRAQSCLQGTASGNGETPAQQDHEPHPSPCPTRDVSNDAVC